MTNNYYNILAESITKKYATPLNEAWGEGVPDWMKGPLMRGNNTDNMLKSKVYQKAYANAEAQGMDDSMAGREAEKAWENSKGTTSVDFADYRQPRGQYTSDFKKTLRAQFMEKGIDLNNPNMKFIEGEPPKSNKDPRLQPPNIGIWYIPSRDGRAYDQVYAKGFNDLEKPFRPVVPAPDRAFVSIPLKTMAEISSKFCYIDGSTIEKRDYETIRQTRRQNELDDNSLIYNGQMRVPKEQRGNWWGGRHFDKSGYLTIPSSQKYAEKLEEAKLKGWAKKLTDTENELNSLLSTYQKTMSTIDILDFDYDFRNAARSFTGYFADAVEYYKSALREIDSIKSAHVVNSKEFLQELKRSYFTDYLKECEKHLNGAKDYFSDYMLSEINI